jgi:hypothetical protein
VRREYALAVAAVAAGALLAWWAMSQPWLTVTEALLGTGVDEASPGVEPAFGAAQSAVQTSGSSLLPAAAAMPVLQLAGIAAVIGSRGWGRRLSGVVIALAALVIVVSTLFALFVDGLSTFAPADARAVTTNTFAPVLAVAGGVVAFVGGALIAWRGPLWPALGRSYERRTNEPKDAWEALDRGIDPTLEATDTTDDHDPPTK